MIRFVVLGSMLMEAPNRDQPPGRFSQAILGSVFSLALAILAGVSHAANATDGVYSHPQATRGEALYQQHCVACHGARLEGNPAAALTGPAFRARWEDGSHTLDDLFYIVRTLMPNSAPGSLSKAEYADVVAYILQVNGYPVGQGELLPKAAVMKPVVLLPH